MKDLLVLKNYPKDLKKMIIQLLVADQFVEAKRIFDTWKNYQVNKKESNG